MEKTKLLLESVAGNYAVAAENICKYIEDPDEKKEQLNDLRKLTLEHAKLAHEFDLQGKAVSHVTSQLKDIKDLEIEKVNKGQVLKNRPVIREIILKYIVKIKAILANFFTNRFAISSMLA